MSEALTKRNIFGDSAFEDDDDDDGFSSDDEDDDDDYLTGNFV